MTIHLTANPVQGTWAALGKPQEFFWAGTGNKPNRLSGHYIGRVELTGKSAHPVRPERHPGRRHQPLCPDLGSCPAPRFGCHPVNVTRLAGHTLPNEGRIYVNSYRQESGPAVCSCGERSEILRSDNARRVWHRTRVSNYWAGTARRHGRTVQRYVFAAVAFAAVAVAVVSAALAVWSLLR